MNVAKSITADEDVPSFARDIWLAARRDLRKTLRYALRGQQQRTYGIDDLTVPELITLL